MNVVSVLFVGVLGFVVVFVVVVVVGGVVLVVRLFGLCVCSVV